LKINVIFDEDTLRHYCSINIPEINQSLNKDILHHAFDIMAGNSCKLCEDFKQTIRAALVREASKRLIEG
jgi:hypothetical protein